MNNITLDIVETANSTDNFQSLIAAAQAAGLVDALKSSGPLTVFAPTDDAFNKLEASKPGTIASLMQPESKETLAGILKYHVIQGKIMASDVLGLGTGSQLNTLLGEPITLTINEGVQVNDATVVQTDIECSNGVIHVIDTVILPALAG